VGGVATCTNSMSLHPSPRFLPRGLLLLPPQPNYGRSVIRMNEICVYTWVYHAAPVFGVGFGLCLFSGRFRIFSTFHFIPFSVYTISWATVLREKLMVAQHGDKLLFCGAEGFMAGFMWSRH
jgi:hypothetical protein